jgi:hypothetical protein
LVRAAGSCFQRNTHSRIVYYLSQDEARIGMQRSLFRIGLIALSAITAFSQSNGSGSSSRFEAADVHVSPRSISFHERDVSGGLLPGDRYSLHRATMLDLIAAAWGVDPEKADGGPSWLEMDRFDILARVPAGTKREGVKPPAAKASGVCLVAEIQDCIDRETK